MPIVDTIKVIFKVSDEGFEQAYEQLILEHNDVSFIRQTDYIFNLVNECIDSKYVIFFTDDDIVYRKSTTTIDEVIEILNVDHMCCLSFRMGVNINERDYGDGTSRKTHTPAIQALHTKKHIIWNRTQAYVGEYWAYPLSVDGHLFSSALMKNILDHIISWPESKTCQQTPNMLESYMQRFFFEVAPLMSSENISCVVNSPNNRVQHDFMNRCGDKYNYSAHSLNKMFLSGKRLSVNIFSDLEVRCPHTELDILNGL